MVKRHLVLTVTICYSICAYLTCLCALEWELDTWGGMRRANLSESLRVSFERTGWLAAKAYSTGLVWCCGRLLDAGLHTRLPPRQSVVKMLIVALQILSRSRYWSENIQLGCESEHLCLNSSHAMLPRHPPYWHHTTLQEPHTVWWLSRKYVNSGLFKWNS